MNVFISHNKHDKGTARLLAIALVEQGMNVWFDEWSIRLGDSLTGGIEKGLSDADIFVLVWSTQAKESNWVGTEIRAYLRRRVDDDSLRIVPVMVDDTPLPTLVADYKGFMVSPEYTVERIACEIMGRPIDIEIAQRLQTRLLELMFSHCEGDPHPYLVCPGCGSTELKRYAATDNARDKTYYIIECEECGWGDWTQ